MPPLVSTTAASAIHSALRDPGRPPRVTWPADSVDALPNDGGCGIGGCGIGGCGVGGRDPGPDQLDGGVGAQLLPGGRAAGGVSGRHWSGGSCAVACCSAMLIA